MTCFGRDKVVAMLGMQNLRTMLDLLQVHVSQRQQPSFLEAEKGRKDGSLSTVPQLGGKLALCTASRELAPCLKCGLDQDGWIG